LGDKYLGCRVRDANKAKGNLGVGNFRDMARHA